MVSMSRLLISSCATFHLHGKANAAGAFIVPMTTVSTTRASLGISSKLAPHQRFLFKRYWSSTPKAHFQPSRFALGSRSEQAEEADTELQMENIYMEWTREDDQLLFENIDYPIPILAAKLGRGLRGVETRLAKLKDVNSFAYQRLFVGGRDSLMDASSESNEGGDKNKSSKLTPASEVLRRIKWDHMLDPDDFTLDYFDRVEDKVLSCSFGAENRSVKGKEELFVFAIPEHRIMAVKYKDRTVWDKVKRLDRVFGSMNGNGETIATVIEGYDEWKQRQAQIDAFNKQRQREMVAKLKTILGEHLLSSLKNVSATLQEKSKAGKLEPQDFDDYVQNALILFRKGRAAANAMMTEDSTPNNSLTTDIPPNDAEALDLLSDLVALLPDDDLRERILEQIYKQVNILDPSRGRKQKNDNRQLPDLDEDSLTETFVRGSGAGGQKINKTANRVVLVHEPTQIRVECQDTRSLQQNRKIARKRMKMKLDEYMNGSQSKNQIKISKKVSKKQKAKARSKARQRKKKESKDA